MRIYLHSFPSHVTSLLKESLLPALTAQQKKILIVASIAFGFLAALYVANRYFQAKWQHSQNNTIELTQDEFKPELNKQEKITERLENLNEGIFKDGNLNESGKTT